MTWKFASWSKLDHVLMKYRRVLELGGFDWECDEGDWLTCKEFLPDQAYGISSNVTETFALTEICPAARVLSVSSDGPPTV
jgi:hypothetical protein